MMSNHWNAKKETQCTEKSSTCANSEELLDSLAICPYRSLLSAGPPEYIQCLHRADLCKSLLVGQHWRDHESETIREPYF